MNSSFERSDSVRIAETPVGKGVFAERGYPAQSVIGEIAGEIIIDSPMGSSYAIEIDERTHLEPDAPFRYLNHNCQPNCEFDSFDEDIDSVQVAPLYLIALREIRAGEELTIDYNWSATSAIPCRCGSPKCRGWIVSIDELHLLPSNS